MKILYVTSADSDNLEDAYLHGLRTLFGAACVDFPRKDIMYKGWNKRPHTGMYGKMFTVWRTLDDIPVDRDDIPAKLKNGFFDLIVFGSIRRTMDHFKLFEPYCNPGNTILLDGEDLCQVDVRLAHRFLYFKRELSAKTTYYYTHKLVPKMYVSGNLITWHPNVLPLSFAIPAEKITRGITRASKKQLFPAHIVDDELRTHARVAGLARNNDVMAHVFDDEQDYYQNLQQSRFGITTKRGGWDCLRHYEIPANGSVMCFKDLTVKYRLNAPLGLSSSNCIIYSSAEELFNTIDRLTDQEYDDLLEAGYRWVDDQTTVRKAVDLLQRVQNRFRR